MLLLPLILHWRNKKANKTNPKKNKDDFHDLYLYLKNPKTFRKYEFIYWGLSQSVLARLCSWTVPVIFIWVYILYPLLYRGFQCLMVIFCLLSLLTCDVIPIILPKPLDIFHKYLMYLHNLRSQILYKSHDKCEINFLWKWFYSVKKKLKMFTWFVLCLPFCYVFEILKNSTNYLESSGSLYFSLQYVSKLYTINGL